MRNKFFAVALTISLAACGKETPENFDFKPGANVIDYKNASSEPKLDFEYTYNETNGKQRFSREITKEEEALFFNNMLDNRDYSPYRFDRRIVEPTFAPEEAQKREVQVRALLDQCVALVGPAPNDRDYRLDDLTGLFPMFEEGTMDMVYLHSVNPSYLSGRMLKCVDFLYGNSDNFKYDHLANFEFPDPKTAPSAKKQKIEQLYEQIYLEIKEAGLLRKIFFTHYPKSFLRERANETGLSKYIKEQEQQGSKLTHGEMAIAFFGSREKWIGSLNQFLEQKMISL